MGTEVSRHAHSPTDRRRPGCLRAWSCHRHLSVVIMPPPPRCCFREEGWRRSPRHPLPRTPSCPRLIVIENSICFLFFARALAILVLEEMSGSQIMMIKASQVLSRAGPAPGGWESFLSSSSSFSWLLPVQWVDWCLMGREHFHVCPSHCGLFQRASLLSRHRYPCRMLICSNWCE